MIAEILENSQMCFEWLKMIVSRKMINSVICGSAVQTPGFSPPGPAKKTPAPAENM